MRRLIGLLLLCLLATSAYAAEPKTKSGFFTTSDGVRLHYLESGQGQAILFVPGWTMPADIWDAQIKFFSEHYHVIAIDPRSQGDSDKPTEGNFPERRARDYKELVDHLKLSPVVLVGWSLGVAELLAYVDQFGPDSVRALVLVDGVLSVPQEMLPGIVSMLHTAQVDRRKFTDAFVRSMYKKPQTEAYLQRVVQASLRTPSNSAISLIAGLMGYRGLASGMEKYAGHPLLIVCRDPNLAKEAQALRDKRPNTRVEFVEDAGHALFVDDADRFNSILADFLTHLSAN